METSVLSTKRFLPHGSEAVQCDVRIAYSDKIQYVEPCKDRDNQADTLVLPPFCNAHDHGRGLRTIAYGASDTTLEAWVPATLTLPHLDPYLIAAAAFARMARAGIGSVVHCHLPRGGPETMLREAIAVKRASEDVGIRVAFVVPLRDRNRLVYGADEKLLSYLTSADVEAVSKLCLKPGPTIQAQIESVFEIAATCESDLFQVQFGPGAVERCSDDLLREVAKASEQTGRRVHMHVLETKYQREWVDANYPLGMAEHLRSVGLLSPRLTIAHGTWMRPSECATFAKHGVTVSINTSSNLRLKSGLAPLEAIHSAKMNFAIGLDALALDDDDDMAREIRLAYLLHRGRGFDEHLTAKEILTAATEGVAKVTSFESGIGRIAKGAPADILVIDFADISSDLTEGLYEPHEVLQARATSSRVRALIVNGRTVVDAGKVCGIDETDVASELNREFAKTAPRLRELRPLLARYQAAQKQYYLDRRHLDGER